jgi:putative membrane protein insertion efficiency factor
VARPRGRFLVALALAVDLALPARVQPSSHLLLGAIRAYQLTLSRLMPAVGVRCRFTPTCSRYGEAVIRQDGTVVGLARAARRILRCGPWTPAGTVDDP